MVIRSIENETQLRGINFMVILMLKFIFFRIKNGSAVTCLKRRDYSSSVPVRYIPKKSSKSNKVEDSELIEVSKKKEFCEFSEASLLDNVVSHGGNGVQKRSNFDTKPQYEHRMLHFNNLPSNDAEQGIAFLFQLLLTEKRNWWCL